MVIKPSNIQTGRQAGKQPTPVIKKSPLPFLMAGAVGLFALMTLWRLHPDIFGKLGLDLYSLFQYAPLVITSMIMVGFVLSWVMVMIDDYDHGMAPSGVKQHYSTALFCLLMMTVVLILGLFWLYFNGVAYYQGTLAELPPDNLTDLLVFGRLPLIITAEMLLGLWIIKHFFTMLEDGMVRHAWHLLMGLCALSGIVMAQFLYLGMVQVKMPIMGLLGDVMMIAMFLYAVLAGFILIGVVLCLVRMALGRYQIGESFSVILLRELWGGLFLLWGLSMLGIIVWRPPLV